MVIPKLALLLLLCAAPAYGLTAVIEPAPAADVSLTVEVLRLREMMARTVPGLLPRTPARDAEWVALARAETATAGFAVDHPQLLVVVDRNPRVQQLMVVMAQPMGDWKAIGGTKVSTGATGRWDYYVTPRGVFRHTDMILGFRAEGTPNENGVRGLGARGMRVWDFGWQVAMKGWAEAVGKPDRTPIRLMMHATDPDKLESRIGRPASQGCIRIPSALNRFLDRHGVLDADYERVAVADIRFRTLLGPERTPTPLAGTALVVVDSSPTPRASVTMASRTP